MACSNRFVRRNPGAQRCQMRIIDGKRKDREWPIDAFILLLRPIWRFEKVNGCNGTDRRVRSNNSSVIENEIVRQ